MLQRCEDAARYKGGVEDETEHPGRQQQLYFSLAVLLQCQMDRQGRYHDQRA